MTYFGIDVSQHNSTIDWARVKGAGIDFAFARAVLCTRPDTMFAANVRGMKANGIIPGAYHFLYSRAWASPEAQCDAFLEKVGNPTGMLLALDVEKDGTSRPDIDDVRRFVARFRERAPGHPLIIYTGQWYWCGGSYPIDNRPGFSYGPLWHSRYVGGTNTAYGPLYATVPASYWYAGFGGWSGVTFLQYQSQGRVPGVSGDVDVNAFRGTEGQLTLLAGSTLSIPDTSTEAAMATALRTESRRIASDTISRNKPGAVLYRDEGQTKVRTLDATFALDDFGVPTGSTGFRAVAIAKGQFDTDGDLEGGIALIRQADVIETRGKTAAELALTAAEFFVPPVAPADTTPFAQADVDAKVAAAVALYEQQHAGDLALIEAFRQASKVIVQAGA